MKILGITGGIGSGKTYVSSIFEHLDVPVYYADVRSKFLMNNDEEIRNKIISLFGNEAYLDEELNRKFLSKAIFENKVLKSKLEEIVHPAVRKDFEYWVKHFSYKPLLIKESALLIESGTYEEMDYIVVVTAPKDIRIKRVVKRDNLNYDDVLKRMNAQLSDNERLKYADFIVDNSGNVLILPQIVEILNKIKANVI